MVLKIRPALDKYLPGGAGFDWFMQRDGVAFRQMSDRRTLRFALGERSFFIKIHFGVGWREIFKNLFLGRLPITGARNEYRAIERLTRLGVETMTWVAYGSRGWNPAGIESFIMTEDLVDTISLEDMTEHWPQHPPAILFKRALIERVAQMARLLHDNGVNHRDFYICHFLFRGEVNNPDSFHLFLIDLHRAQIRSRVPLRWRLKDIAGLHFSSMTIGLTRSDRMRFIRSYRQKPLREIFAQEGDFWQKVQKKAEVLLASYPGRS